MSDETKAAGEGCGGLVRGRVAEHACAQQGSGVVESDMEMQLRHMTAERDIYRDQLRGCNLALAAAEEKCDDLTIAHAECPTLDETLADRLEARSRSVHACAHHAARWEDCQWCAADRLAIEKARGGKP